MTHALKIHTFSVLAVLAFAVYLLPGVYMCLPVRAQLAVVVSSERQHQAVIGESESVVAAAGYLREKNKNENKNKRYANNAN